MKRFVSIVVSVALSLIVGILGILGKLGKYKILKVPKIPNPTPISISPLRSPILHHNDAPLAAISCNKNPLK